MIATGLKHSELSVTISSGVELLVGPPSGVELLVGPASGVELLVGPASGVELLVGPAIGVDQSSGSPISGVEHFGHKNVFCSIENCSKGDHRITGGIKYMRGVPTLSRSVCGQFSNFVTVSGIGRSPSHFLQS